MPRGRKVIMNLLLILMLLFAPGQYLCQGHPVYVGIEHSPPDPSANETYPACRGSLQLTHGMHEERRIVNAPQGRLGVSLYYAGAGARTTVILVHGNDAETREMGYIAPFFVTNGVNVISYDQRGTGESVGNWFLSGPQDRADDVYAIMDSYAHDPHIDRDHLGIWGFSNGGWTAPLVAVHRHLAFVILKSAAAESVRSNMQYEVAQQLRRYHESPEHIADALAMVHALLGALDGSVSWNDAGAIYTNAKAQPWFAHSLMIDMPMPPPQALQDGLRRTLSFDPASTLSRLRTPTLALYGTADIRVDVPDSSRRLAAYVQRARNQAFTMRFYPGAPHNLSGTKYPEDMLAWLRSLHLIVSN